MTALLEMENSGLIALLRDDKYDDLARLYSLMRRVDNGLPTVSSRGFARPGGCI
jgi:cullin 3